MRIDQLMSPEVQYCSPSDTLETAAAQMWQHDCGCVPVCSGNGTPEVIGMITDRDICMCTFFQGKPLRDLLVADAMSRGVYTCRPGDRPAEVERTMRRQQVRRMPVIDRDRRLVGIVSLADLAREAGESGDTPASEIGATLAAICEPARSRTAEA
ncbi:MAG TPA: CBS domain-containing protein [Gammaproteobacteria bacterium]|nr:CBS domain-containing protein [Gammaproteobacteria bacterium]